MPAQASHSQLVLQVHVLAMGAMQPSSLVAFDAFPWGPEQLDHASAIHAHLRRLFSGEQHGWTVQVPTA